MSHKINREQWKSRIGFVFATAGSAVGLGNIWRFPYIATKNGGGAFLIIYLALVIIIGFSTVLVEFAIGRRGQTDPVSTFYKQAKTKKKFWGVFGLGQVVVVSMILAYYVVIAGWALNYVVSIINGKLALNTTDITKYQEFFGTSVFTGGPAILFALIFVLIVGLVVVMGVNKGIERTSMFLMPLLFIILVIIVIRAITLPGSMEGLKQYLYPDFSKVTGQTFIDALGQAFFSLSIGFASLLVYSSYIGKKENVITSAKQVVFFDTLIAVLAGFAIIPTVIAFQDTGGDMSDSVGLAFFTLPSIFARMPFGSFFGIAFFLLLLIAALTSAISMLEPGVAFLLTKGKSRLVATLVLSGAVAIVSIPHALGVNIFGVDSITLIDDVINTFFIPGTAAIMCLFVGWIIKKKVIGELTNDGEIKFGLIKVWFPFVKYVLPFIILILMITGFIAKFPTYLESYKNSKKPAMSDNNIEMSEVIQTEDEEGNF